MIAASLLAQPALCPVAAAGATADCLDASEQIDATLRDEAHRVRVWRLAWGLGATVVAGAQGGIALATDDHDLRVDMTVGAISTLGLFLGVLLPPDIETSPHAEACPARLVESQKRLLRAADNERSARSPLFHVANGLFNIGVGLVLGLGYGHWTSGAVNAAVGFAVGEAQLLTAPSGASSTQLTIAPGTSPTTVGLSFVF